MREPEASILDLLRQDAEQSRKQALDPPLHADSFAKDGFAPQHTHVLSDTALVRVMDLEKKPTDVDVAQWAWAEAAYEQQLQQQTKDAVPSWSDVQRQQAAVALVSIELDAHQQQLLNEDTGRRLQVIHVPDVDGELKRRLLQKTIPQEEVYALAVHYAGLLDKLEGKAWN